MAMFNSYVSHYQIKDDSNQLAPETNHFGQLFAGFPRAGPSILKRFSSSMNENSSADVCLTFSRSQQYSIYSIVSMVDNIEQMQLLV